MTSALVLFLAVCFLAYSNGANDNFKGVATLFGSGAAGYRKALGWATLSTLAGSAASIVLARELIRTFSGKGLVPPELAGTPNFLLAVSLGAGGTVMLATRTGFPVSTTHALTGALVGGGLAAAGPAVDLGVLGSKFFLPLLASPLIAVALAAALYAPLKLARVRLGVSKEWRVSIGGTERVVPIPQPAGGLSFAALRAPEAGLAAALAPREACVQRYKGALAGVSLQALLDATHYASAGLVSFARGLNDTPKIVALLLGLEALGLRSSMAAVGIAMAVGGILNARRVAETVSKKITPLNHGQGLSANLATAFLVIFASRLGVPVSTTHVSVGSIFGIGAVAGGADTRVVRGILLSWVLTLPVAAVLSAAAYALAA